MVPTQTTEPEVLGEQAGRATGRLYTSCQRTVRATMANRSDRTRTYKVKVGKRVIKKKVTADRTVVWTSTAKNGARVKLWLGKRLLAAKRVPKPCRRPEILPATGKRAESWHEASRLRPGRIR